MELGKRVFIGILFLWIGCFQSLAQSMDSFEGTPMAQPNIPQERIFVHYNTTLLFAGEYLHYKVYNLDTSTKGLSGISKIAYVELIGENQEQVFKHKLRLKNGTGYGDFFIPTTVPSGNYMLIGYTQWMKNVSKGHFFYGDMAIINPYQADQGKILVKNDSIAINEALNNNRKAKRLQMLEVTEAPLALNTDLKQYGKRSKVSLSIEGLPESLAGGSFSLSVRKIDTIAIPGRPGSTLFSEQNLSAKETGNKAETNTMYLPELRGELLSGKILAKDSNIDVASLDVAVSIPGKNGFDLKVVTTNKEGRFYVGLEKESEGDQAIVQVLGKSRHNYQIVMDNDENLNYPNLEFGDFGLLPEMKQMIVERSVYNQIENGYFLAKPDSLENVPAIFPFDNEKMFTYNLDDYTRFPTIRETIVEVVDLVWAKRVAKEEFVFQILPYGDDFYLSPQFQPLVIVDGVPVQDQTHLLYYDARKVRSIGFIRDKYVVGPKIFQGVLNIETFNGDYYISPDGGAHQVAIDLFKPEPRKKYFQQRYDETAEEDVGRLLDFRRQLLWEPNLNLQGTKTNIGFYTSDITGYFEIALEGFSKDGTPFSIRKLIRVE